MELGQYQLQIFVSLVVILGAAFVALICDFLKGNNEQLRELTIELKVRREEEHKRDLLITPRPFEALPMLHTAAPPERAALAEAQPKAAEIQDADSRPAPSKVGVSAARRRGESRRPIAAEALAAMERGASLATASFAGASAAASKPASAFAKSLAARAGVEKANESVPNATADSSNSEAAPKEVHVELIAPRTAPAVTNVATMPSRPNWSDLLARRAGGHHQDVRESVGLTTLNLTTLNQTPNVQTTAAGSSSPAEPGSETLVPTGFHDGYVLSRLVQSHKPVSGLVVSIGVSAEKENGEADTTAVRHLIQSLIGPQDFACASAPNEYLLIFPQERGVAAQRRLADIAQQLWDFQLNTLGEASILFSWGGVEVRGESIEEAIASASERMQETRRGRSILAFEAQALKKAV